MTATVGAGRLGDVSDAGTSAEKLPNDPAPTDRRRRRKADKPRKNYSSADRVSVRGHTTAQRMRSAWPLYVAVAPFFIIFICFGLIPVVFTMALAFTDWNGLGDINWIAWENFSFLIHDEMFAKSVVNSLTLFVLGTTPNIILATIVALLLHRTRRGATFYRVVYLLPNVTSVVALGLLFRVIFAGEDGPANQIIGLFGFDNIRWLNDIWGIKIAIATLSCWTFVGYNALIILAGLQSLPKSVFEAAALDGAGPVRTFFHITLPMLRPIMIFLLLMSTIGSLQGFTEAQVMTSSSGPAATAGGLDNSGMTMVLYFFSVAFGENRYGYGATIAWGIFGIVTFFTVINWLVSRGKKQS